VVNAFTPDTVLSDAIAAVTRAQAGGFVASYGDSKLDKSCRLCEIPYKGGTIVLHRVSPITFRFGDRELVLPIVENESVLDVKAKIAEQVPDIGNALVFQTARAGELDDGRALLDSVESGEVVEVTEKPRLYKFRRVDTGEEHTKSFERQAIVADALASLSKKCNGRPIKLFLSSPDQPLDPSLVLAQCVPGGAELLYAEEKLSYTIDFQGQKVNLAIDPDVTFVALKKGVLSHLLPGQAVDESQYGFFVGGKEVSEKREGSAIPSIAGVETELMLRVRESRVMFSFMKKGKPQGKALRVPEETAIADVYRYWTRKTKMHVSLWIRDGKINRRATARLKDCNFGDQTIEVRTKDLKYFFQLPGVERLAKLRLKHNETVKIFKARLTIGETVPIEINGNGEAVRANRIKIRYRNEVLKDIVRFVELETDEDPSHFFEVSYLDPVFVFQLNGEHVHLRLPANLAVEEAERRISARVGQPVYLAAKYRREPALRETSRPIDLTTLPPAPVRASQSTPNVLLQREEAPPPAPEPIAVNFDALVKVSELDANDAVVSVLFADPNTEDLWILHFRCDGQHPPIPALFLPLATLDHPAVLAVRRLVTQSGQAIPNYCVERAIASLAQTDIPGWSDTTVTLAILGLVFGLRYLHLLGIVHGTLYPANVYLSEGLEPKFGPPGIPNPADPATAPYVAPELRTGAGATFASDVFALAATVYDLATNGHQAFGAGSLDEVFAIQSGRTRPPFPDCVHASIAEILGRAWSPVPAERPTASEIYAAVINVRCLPIGPDNIDNETVVEYYSRLAAWEKRLGLPSD
jgi:hypothetical protein